LFQKLLAFTKKVSDFADHVTGNASDNKAQFDAAPEELRTYFNNLIDGLKSTSSDDSGAKNIGAKSIADLSGSDVQSLIESLKTYSDGKFVKNGGRTIVEGMTDTIQVLATETTRKSFTITLPQSFKSDGDITNIQITPISDIYFSWFVYWSLNSWNKNSITIHLRNTGYADGFIRFAYQVSGNM
jgi:hypothetical protein